MNFFKDEIFTRIVLLALGSILGVIATKVKDKTKKVIYKVNTQQIAVSTQDAIFGNVNVLWKDRPVNNLYFTTITVENVSTHDFKDIKFKVFSVKEVKLLTEATKVIGSAYSLKWSDEFKELTKISPGGQITDLQWSTYYSSREYHCDVLNRGQKLEIQLLSTNTAGSMFPAIFLDCLYPGVKLKQQINRIVSYSELWGVPILSALIWALLISAVTVTLTGLYINTVWIAGVVCMLVGLFGQILGVLVIKILKYIRNLVAG